MPAISRRAAASDHGRSVLLEECREVAVTGVFEGQVVEHAAVGTHQREHVVDADRPRMAVEQLAEVRLADPAVDARAGLDADALRHARRAPEPAGQIDLAEAAFAEKFFDAIVQAGFRAGDRLVGDQQAVAALHRDVDGCGAARRRELTPERAAGCCHAKGSSMA